MRLAKVRFRSPVGVCLKAGFVVFTILGGGVDGFAVHAAVLEAVCYWDSVWEMYCQCDRVVVTRGQYSNYLLLYW